MKKRIANELLTRIYANGGHWCEITMKATGAKFKIARAARSSFEYLDRDAFWMSGPTMEHRLFENIEAVAEFIYNMR